LKCKIIILVVLNCCTYCGLRAQAVNDVTLSWSPPLNSVPAGYNIYYGPSSGVYTQRLHVGNATTVKVPHLSSGQIYFFAVTSYNSKLVESTTSNEIAYTVPFPSAPSAPVPFVMDGVADSAGYVQYSTAMEIYAAVRGTKLYLATWSPGSTGGPNDHFIFVSDQLLTSATTRAPWAKAGMIAVPPNKPYLAGESMNSYVGWFNAPSDSQFAKAPTNSGVMEGVLDLVEAFGSMPQKIYVAAAAYKTFDGGVLASQGPIGNGDGNIDPTEFVTLWIPAITDQFAYGIYDWLNPNVGLHAQITRTTTSAVLISWPSVPGKTYQVEVADLRTGKWQLVQSPITAGTGVLRLSISYSPANSDTRFYEIRCLNP
jgi:hypothetical protein